MREPPTDTLTHQRCWRCGNTTATHSRHDWRELTEKERQFFGRLPNGLQPTLIGRRHIACECGFVEDCPELFVP